MNVRNSFPGSLGGFRRKITDHYHHLEDRKKKKRIWTTGPLTTSIPILLVPATVQNPRGFSSRTVFLFHPITLRPIK
ncbi:hypothetical protein AVEN_152111-1, partial [Araneus ventricosus]